MGTFHDDHGELHGITVVVDTHGSTIYIGRCDHENEQEVLLLDVAEHEDGHDGRSKDEWVRHTAKFGIWKQHDRLTLPRGEVVSIRRLGQIKD